MADGLAGGFQDRPREAAAVFRAALDAMARPGRVQEVRGIVSPGDLSPAAAALLLALADQDAPIWLPPRLAEGDLARWLLFHTNAPQARPAHAAFAVGTWAELQPLGQWSIGEPAYPDRSATLIIEVPALCGGRRMTLTGPGIETYETLAPMLPEGAPDAISEIGRAFPLGLDIFFTAASSFAALARSTRIGGV